MSLHSINHEQRLYVLNHGTGYTCLGFEYAEKKRVAVLGWLGVTAAPVELGTKAAYVAYKGAMGAGQAHHIFTGKKCPADLIPALDAYVGWRVEVRSTDGTKRRFNVGRSSGWMPCNIELANVRSHGGVAAHMQPGDIVVAIRKVH